MSHLPCVISERDTEIQNRVCLPERELGVWGQGKEGHSSVSMLSCRLAFIHVSISAIQKENKN